jgi:superfamily I DNA/RNA helicase
MPAFIADTFMHGLAKLSTDEQTAVKAAVFDFQLRPEHPSFQYHRVHGSTDAWSARVNRDIRMIVYQHDDTRVLSYVDHHDPAYTWARRRRLDVHETTGAAQFVVIDERVETQVRRVEHTARAREEDTKRPFAGLDDATLLAYGVPRASLALVRDASLAAFLDVVGDTLPDEAQEYLLRVADGEAPDVAERARDPFTSPDARRRFYLVDEHDQALRRALAAPWATWQLFLHPSQRRAVEADHDGPARVTGGPGTGKSVVAVHRAAHLARTRGGRVLLTSFTRTLTARLAADLDQLLGGDPTTRARIATPNLHHLAMEYLTAHDGAQPAVASNQALQRIVEDAAATASASGFSPASVAAEWHSVIDPYGIDTLTEYLHVDRAARGMPLQPHRRRALWPTIERIRALLREAGLRTWSDVCWRVSALLDDGGAPPFDHLVADEVQDFGPAELRLLRSLAAPGPNDVFLAGDVNQRIYRPRSHLNRAGLEVRGRTTILRLNYRTTEQIRRRAQRILGPTPCRAHDTDDPGPPATSLLAGPEPEIRCLPSVRNEIDTLTGWLKRLVGGGYRPGEIALLARTNALLHDRARHAIAAAGLQGHALADDEEPPTNRVAIGTMHRSKGLQFRAVAVLGAEVGEVPIARVLEKQADAAARAAFLELERNLLYVACSRARERLLVTGVKALSSFLTSG